MTPQQLLACIDSGQLWPEGGAQAFTDKAAAYQAALGVRALRIARGEVPRGFKIGFTNRGIWERYGVYAPIWGTVWNSTLSWAQEGDAVSLSHTCQPRIEPEVVFAFRSTPAPGCNLEQLFDALDWLAPGFEVVQSHQPDWKFQAAQTMADSGLHARLHIGQALPLRELVGTGQALHTLLAHASVQLMQGERVVDEGRGALVLDSPLQALLHFVTELRSCPGAPDIAPGDIVTTGTWTDAWPVAPGQHWQARFTAPLPGVDVQFS